MRVADQAPAAPRRQARPHSTARPGGGAAPVRAEPRRAWCLPVAATLPSPAPPTHGGKARSTLPRSHRTRSGDTTGRCSDCGAEPHSQPCTHGVTLPRASTQVPRGSASLACDAFQAAALTIRATTSGASAASHAPAAARRGVPVGRRVRHRIRARHRHPQLRVSSSRSAGPCRAGPRPLAASATPPAPPPRLPLSSAAPAAPPPAPPEPATPTNSRRRRRPGSRALPPHCAAAHPARSGGIGRRHAVTRRRLLAGGAIMPAVAVAAGAVAALGDACPHAGAGIRHFAAQRQVQGGQHHERAPMLACQRRFYRLQGT